MRIESSKPREQKKKEEARRAPRDHRPNQAGNKVQVAAGGGDFMSHQSSSSKDFGEWDLGKRGFRGFYSLLKGQDREKEKAIVIWGEGGENSQESILGAIT